MQSQSLLSAAAWHLQCAVVSVALKWRGATLNVDVEEQPAAASDLQGLFTVQVLAVVPAFRQCLIAYQASILVSCYCLLSHDAAGLAVSRPLPVLCSLCVPRAIVSKQVLSYILRVADAYGGALHA